MIFAKCAEKHRAQPVKALLFQHVSLVNKKHSQNSVQLANYLDSVKSLVHDCPVSRASSEKHRTQQRKQDCNLWQHLFIWGIQTLRTLKAHSLKMESIPGFRLENPWYLMLYDRWEVVSALHTPFSERGLWPKMPPGTLYQVFSLQKMAWKGQRGVHGLLV